MKAKNYIFSIVLNAFIGYLWLLFANHIIGIANSLNNAFIVGGIIISLGTILFWSIIKRINPYKEYKYTHPIRIIGYISLIMVAIIGTFIFDIA